MNTSEFNELYQKNYQALLNYTNYLTKDVNESKDIVQEAMIKAYHSLDQLDDPAKFKNWASVIIRNLYINKYKKRNRRKDLRTTTKFKINVTERTTVTNEGLQNLNTEFLVKKIRSIKPIYGELLLMHASGYAYQEIADRYQVPIGTVKSRISTGRNLLKKELEPAGYNIAA